MARITDYPALRLHVSELFPGRQLSRHTVAARSAAHLAQILALDHHSRIPSQLSRLFVAAVHEVLEIDFRAFKPLVRIDEPPDKGAEHWSTIHNHRPIHRGIRQILPFYAGKTQQWHHQGHKPTRHGPDRNAPASEIPGSGAKTVADEKHANENRGGEGDEGRAGADAEDGADSKLSSKNEKQESISYDVVEPDGVDGSLRVPVDAFPVLGERKAAVAGVGEGDT